MKKDLASTQAFRSAQPRLLQRAGLEAESRFIDLPSVSGPVHLLTTGEGAPVVLVPGFGDPAALVPDAEFHLIPGAGHLPWIAQAGPVGEFVASFLRASSLSRDRSVVLGANGATGSRPHTPHPATQLESHRV